MAGVLHWIECAAHGEMEARVNPKKLRCPHGCSPEFVKIIWREAPAHVSGRTKAVDRHVREAAAAQGLSDISTSPSRPGGSVMDRLRLKKGRPDKLHQAGWGALPGYDKAFDARNVAGTLQSLTGGARSGVAEITGIGKPYNPAEWKKGEDGKLRHVGGTPLAPDFKPRARVAKVVDP
jgi:hypothetical protein